MDTFQQTYDDSIIAELEKKYLCDQHVESFIDIFGTSPCKLATEKGLELVVLQKANISHVGDQAKFASLCMNVSDLDLAWNNISSWTVVSTILSSLPSLARLNLAHNPMKPKLDVDSLPVSPKLSTLVLNGTQLPLGTTNTFLDSMPALRELHMSENHFNDLDQWHQGPICNTVQVVHLNACGFTDWRKVVKLLSLLPTTQSLYLVDNPLQTVERECGGLQTAEVTKCIRSLSLTECRLNNWRAIENLQWVGQLEELRIRSIPLLDGYSDEERFHLLVGRLRTLSQLNGSTITPSQREESERFFIRYYQCAEEKPAIYEELVKKHGNLEQLVKIDLTPQKFAKVMMRCEETDYLAPVRIRLNSTVLGLMKYATKITGIPDRRMRIFYFDVDLLGSGPSELRFPNQLLSSLHVKDGDEFFIQSKIVPTKQKSSP